MTKGYLLDTHVIIWLLSQPNKLSKQVQDIIQNPNNQLYYSLLSMNEIAIKASLGKIVLADNWQIIYQNLLVDKQVILLDMKWQAVTILQNLPFHHRDPFDRMLIAQAMANDLALISADSHYALYDLLVIW